MNKNMIKKIDLKVRINWQNADIHLYCESCPLGDQKCSEMRPDGSRQPICKFYWEDVQSNPYCRYERFQNETKNRS